MNPLTSDQLKLLTFLPCLNTKFRVGVDPASFVELELAEASDLNPASRSQPGKGPELVSFSLIFNGPDNRFLPQQIHAFAHDRIGRFELFIVPIGQKPGIIQYQAVFSRLVQR
jgi:hypothetical protein